MLVSAFPAEDPSPWNGASHILSITKTEVCLPGDSKSTRDRDADEPHTLMEAD